MPLIMIPGCDWPNRDQLVVSARGLAADRLREGQPPAIIHGTGTGTGTGTRALTSLSNLSITSITF